MPIKKPANFSEGNKLQVKCPTKNQETAWRKSYKYILFIVPKSTLARESTAYDKLFSLLPAVLRRRILLV